MICFKIFVNGQRVTSAGLAGFGVLNSILTWVCRENDESRDCPEFNLDVSGLEGNTHLSWYSAPMKVGDTINIEVHDADLVDEPKRRTTEEAGTDDRSLLMKQVRFFEKRLAEARQKLEDLEAAP